MNKKQRSRVNSEKRKQIDPLEQAIETALSPGSFISYNAAWSFVDDVRDVANNIEKIIQNEPERAAKLYETFIAACHEKADEIDDSSGNFGMLVEDLVRGWIKARQAASDDPDETAKALYCSQSVPCALHPDRQCRQEQVLRRGARQH
ncbi:MAG: hypothetical protein V2B19_17695 [Pseudomonadota bacterium]